MSYNGSGTFVINTSGQPVVTGTVISSTAFNALTADLGTGLSTAITKDGQTTTTAKIPFAAGLSAAVASNFAAGTVAAPAIYLLTDTGSGLYRIGANNDGFAINGAKVLDIASTGLAVTGTLSATTTVAGSGGASTLSVPTRQVFLTGTAATYTTPANCRRIVVRSKGGGGGGAGSADATANATAGGTGGTTIFNSINANGGAGGTPATGGNVTTAKGGNAGTGTASVRIAGATGGAPQYHYNAATTAFGLGGVGGGQGGGNNTSGTGGAGTANSGGGGAGGPNGTASAFATIYTFQIAPAGGEGEYAEIAISSPAASYTYTVGAGGTAGAAGTNGNAGGVGGSGYIIVDEYY